MSSTTEHDQTPDTPAASAEAPSVVRFGESWAWWCVLLVFLGWHAWMTLSLFGLNSPWDGLVSPEPIVAGQHALHLYHGYLGGQAMRDRARTICYDPFFYSGYIKTPWFDAASKPAELAQWVTAGQYNPAAYKIAIALIWFLVPCLVAVGAERAGLNPGTTFLAGFWAIMICWTDFGRQRLVAGDLDVVLAAALLAATIGLAIRYHKHPHVASGLPLLVTAWLTGLCQPLMLVGMLPLFFLFYFSTGFLHKPFWHLGFLGIVALAYVGNWPWINDALRYWWVRAEPASAATAFQDQSIWRSMQAATLWASPLQRWFGVLLLVLALVGVAALVSRGHKIAGRVLGLGVALFAGIALVGASWEPVQQVDPSRFFVAALLLAAIPAGESIIACFDLMGRLLGRSLFGAAVCWAVLIALGAVLHEPLADFWTTCIRREMLPQGLSSAVADTVKTVQARTTTEARILWEEDAVEDAWSPLLPMLTQRAFVGGLKANLPLEHAGIRLAQGRLAGRPLGEWTDAAFLDYCRRHNIGWVACHSRDAVSRLEKLAGASKLVELANGKQLFAIQRTRSYVLTGKARVLACDHKMLTLADLAPADGQIVLSFHYHSGIVPSSDRVQIEKDPQLHDGIPFIRLRMSGPVAWLTLRWSDE